ncbi:MAG: PilN domain-containing protein [bacterium]
MIRINLLPRKPKPLIALWRDGVITGAVLLILLLSWSIVMVNMNRKLNRARGELQQVKKQIEDSKLDLKKVEQLKQHKAVLENKINIIHSLREKQAGPVHVLDDISATIPEQVWLDNLNNIGTSLTLGGLSPSYNAVSEFMRELAHSPYFTNIELRNIQQSIIQSKKYQRFNISCQVQFIPPVSEKAEKVTEEKKT